MSGSRALSKGVHPSRFPKGVSRTYLEELFRDLPPVDDDKLPPLLNPKNGQCVLTKKFVPLQDMPVVDTGIVMALEPLSKEALKTFKDQARVVCVTCREVILWLDPHKDKHGFEFKTGKFYHVRNCPQCKEGLQKSQILEKVVYYRDKGIPYE